MLFFDIGKQIFFKNNSVAVRRRKEFLRTASTPAAHEALSKQDLLVQDISHRQKLLNEDLEPSTVIRTLKSRLQDQSKYKIQELELSNLKLT